MKKNVGLVLAGGGAKGAYQIGVWKAICELGIDKQIGAISGTSIGAINTAIFATKPVDKIEEIWSTFKTSDFAKLDSKSISRFFTKGKGLVKNDGIKEKFQENFEFFKIKRNRRKLFATASVLSSNKYDDVMPKVESLRLNKCKNYEEFETVLLASAAIPVVYDQQELDGTIYEDGGKYMNEPIEPLTELGYKYIIVVALNKRKQDLLDLSLEEKAKYLFIKPSTSSGFSSISALNFNQSLLEKRKALGYKDAVNAFKCLIPEDEEHLKPRKRKRLIKRNIKKMVHFE